MVLKNIKVTENVKSDLDAIAYEKETYNVTINRLIRENERLKLENYRLHYDKKVLTRLLLNNESISDIDAELKFVPFIESVLFDSDLPDDEKIDTLKRYFFEIVGADVDLIKSCVGIVKETHSVSDGALIEFESYINNSII
jgi:hypothetical protein